MEQQGLGPPFLCFTQGLLLLHAVALVVPALETVSLVDLCGQTLGGGGMVVRSHAESRRFYFVAEGTDCWLTMRAAAPRDQIQFQFHFFLVYNLAPGPAGPTGQSAAPTPSGPGSGRGPASRPCSLGSSVRFYDGDGPTAAPLGPPLCGTTIPGPVRSSGRSLTIRLVTRRQQPRVDFVGHFAAFRFETDPSSCGEGGYFRCGDGRCISRSLLCDLAEIDHCGDGGDRERRSPAECAGLSTSLAPQSTTHAHPRALTSHGPSRAGSGKSQSGAPRPTLRGTTAVKGQGSPEAVLSGVALLLGSAGPLAGLLGLCCCPGRCHQNSPRPRPRARPPLWADRAFPVSPFCNSPRVTCRRCPCGCLRPGRGRWGTVTPQPVAAPVPV